MKKPLVVITGATDGIGRDLSRIYSRQGARLFAIGRRPLERVEEDFLTPDNYCQCDLSDRCCSATLSGFLHKRGVDAIDLLILNAATGDYGPVGSFPRPIIDEVINVNLRAPVFILRNLAPLLARAGGKAILISSVVSTLPCPDFAVYAASKAALDGLARSLRLEFRGSIDIQVIRPGATRTGLHRKIGVRRESMDWSGFTPSWETAHSIADLIQRSHLDSTLGLANRALRRLGLHLPNLLTRLAARRGRK